MNNAKRGLRNQHNPRALATKLLASALAVMMTMAFTPFPALAWASDADTSGSAGAQSSDQANSASSADAAGAAASSNNAGSGDASSSASSNTGSSSAAESSASSNASASTAEPLFQIGDATYATLPEAASAAKKGDVIYLMKDADLTKEGVISLDGMTLDLNGHAISADNSTLVLRGNDMVVRNGSFSAKGGSYGLFLGDNPTSVGILAENLNIDGGVNIFNSADVVLKNVNADNSNAKTPYYAVWGDINSQATILSGTYKSVGPATLGMTDQRDGQPVCQMLVKGGDYLSGAKALVLGGDKRYKPQISGGTFYNAEQAAPFLKAGYTLIENANGTASVVEQNADSPKTDTELPSGSELITTSLSADLKHSVDAALNQPEIKAALDKTTGTAPLWEANVVLRDKATLAEVHDTVTTFVLPYPDGFDSAKYQDYDFTVVHVNTNGSGSDASTTPEILKSSAVVPQAGGLQITSTLSPFIISYKYNAAQVTPEPQPQQPTTPAHNENPNHAAPNANTGSTTATNGEPDAIPNEVVQNELGDRANTAAGKELTYAADADEVIESFVGVLDVERAHNGNEAAGIDPIPIVAGSVVGIAAIALIAALAVRHNRKKNAQG